MRTSNFVSLTGNLGAEVEYRALAPGKEVALLSVAETLTRYNVERDSYEDSHTNWVPVAAFSSLAKRVAFGLKKGDRVTVIGELKTTSYEKNGEKRRGFEVIAHTIELAELLPASVAILPSNTQPTAE